MSTLHTVGPWPELWLLTAAPRLTRRCSRTLWVLGPSFGYSLQRLAPGAVRSRPSLGLLDQIEGDEAQGLGVRGLRLTRQGGGASQLECHVQHRGQIVQR